MRGHPIAPFLLAMLIGAGPAAGQPTGVTQGDPIRINGSSTVLPFAQEAVRSFQEGGREPSTRFDVGAAGTTGGLRQFCQGQLSIATASRPISRAELDRCASRGIRFLELPIAFDAITVVVHPSNRWLNRITTEQLSKLWNRRAEGAILRWSQVNPSWPDRAFRLCGPGRDSGTFDTFNKAVNGKETDSRRDYVASEDDDVLVRCVAGERDALGYFGFEYYNNNRSILKALAVTGPLGPVLPSVESAQKSRYVPLSRVIFFYVNERALKQNPALRQFVNETLQRGPLLAQRSGVIPLPDSTYRLVETKLYRNILGSAFAGSIPIGLSLGQVLKRSFDEHKRPQFR